MLICIWGISIWAKPYDHRLIVYTVEVSIAFSNI